MALEEIKRVDEKYLDADARATAYQQLYNEQVEITNKIKEEKSVERLSPGGVEYFKKRSNPDWERLREKQRKDKMRMIMESERAKNGY